MTSPYVLFTPPPAGAYWIGGNVALCVNRKPRWLHRLAVRWVLGWEWRDSP